MSRAQKIIGRYKTYTLKTYFSKLILVVVVLLLGIASYYAYSNKYIDSKYINDDILKFFNDKLLKYGLNSNETVPAQEGKVTVSAIENKPKTQLKNKISTPNVVINPNLSFESNLNTTEPVQPKIYETQDIEPEIEAPLVQSKIIAPPVKPKVIKLPPSMGTGMIKVKTATRKDIEKRMHELFNNAPNYLNALKLAKFYYRSKKYEKAIKWSFTANSHDKTQDESWAIYARSASALGKKKMAIKAINTYLSSNYSKKLVQLKKELR